MTLTVAWLLAGLGSVMPGLRWTVFATLVFFSVKKPLMRTVALAPGARPPRLAESGPVEPAGVPWTDPWVVVADWTTKLSGRTSRRAALSVGRGPLLVTTMV